jgi:hypothetical protein
VASSYEIESTDRAGEFAGLDAVRKYSSFPSHQQFWETLVYCERHQVLHNLHEVLNEDQPRCLYFDLDGLPSYRGVHNNIVAWLQAFVRWFFSADSLGWPDEYPTPVLLKSGELKKYSCHVVFPQIQFENYEHQTQYMSVLLSALPALVVDLEGQQSVKVLEVLVDRVPYTKFQLFRGPNACKLSLGELRRSTRLVPEEYFMGDPLTCFTGYVNKDYALQLPSLSHLLGSNEELRKYHERQIRRVPVCSGIDQTNLFVERFEYRQKRGKLDLAGLPPIEQYEVCLDHLHPERASDWLSWFRICGVTFSMLEQFGHDQTARIRIWDAHCKWSSQYLDFDEAENEQMVHQARGKRVSGLGLLMQLVQHDNPLLQVRESTWPVPPKKQLNPKKTPKKTPK